MKQLLGIACLLSASVFSNAQTAETSRPAELCSAAKIVARQQQQYKTTVADLAEDNYDIKHVKLDIQLTPANAFVTGNAVTTAVVVADSLPVYVFELRSFLVVDSFKLNGQLLPVTGTGTPRTAVLPVALQQGATFTAQVFYHGQPPSAGPFSSFGIRNQVSPSWGTRVTYTLSQPYAARDWWPTKQSLTDKIDSADLWYTVPDTCKAGGNGLLQAVVPMANNRAQYQWKSIYPIDYYLISAAVAPYIDYSYYIQLPSGDSVLYQNYIYNNPAALPAWQAGIDSVADMMLHLSELFGEYPFKDEKYGHCMAPLSGGMEHQTMTTQGFFSTTLSVHELGHQWFGDHVTCGSWKDIWLNEGFASYSEYLFADHFWGHPQAYDYMWDIHEHIRSEPGGTVYVDDTTVDSRIFDSRLSYDKGSAIVHTLRFVFNNDSLFFDALRNYQQTFAFATATTEDLQQITETALGQNMDTFYQQWIYKEGYPIYAVKWNQVSDTVIVELTQSTSQPGSQTLFSTPLELRLQSGAGDTTIRVYNSQNVQTYQFVWAGAMTGLTVDPNNWIIDTTVSIVKDPALVDVNDVHAARLQVVPNPATAVWTVFGIDNPSQLVLSDMNGRTIWRGEANGQVTVPAANLASGMYVLKVSNKKETHSIKLIKQ